MQEVTQPKTIRIRSEKTIRMIHELAALLGVSAEEAVRIAMEERLARLTRERNLNGSKG
jgi:hypothetical protein